MSDLPITELRALTDTVRLRILHPLPRRNICDLVCNVSELAAELKLPQSTVSRHLAILLQAGLVRKERMCRDVYYYLDTKKQAEVRRALNQLGARK
jgi:DNA-binding transcriptional ArsR family regulator